MPSLSKYLFRAQVGGVPVRTGPFAALLEADFLPSVRLPHDDDT